MRPVLNIPSPFCKSIMEQSSSCDLQCQSIHFERDIQHLTTGPRCLPLRKHSSERIDHPVKVPLYRLWPEMGLNEFALSAPRCSLAYDESVAKHIRKPVVNNALFIECVVRLLQHTFDQ